MTATAAASLAVAATATAAAAVIAVLPCFAQRLDGPGDPAAVFYLALAAAACSEHLLQQGEVQAYQKMLYQLIWECTRISKVAERWAGA